MLADSADYVVGVDTHKDTLTAAAVEVLTGQTRWEASVPACASGYERLLELATEQAPGRCVWAIEGTGSYGAGLACLLGERGERVVEVDCPKRTERGRDGKSDPIDALRAARKALASSRHHQPRARGDREAIRVLSRAREGALKARTQAIGHLEAMCTSAPEGLRSKLRGLRGRKLVDRCRRLRANAASSCEERSTITALGSIARRIVFLEQEAKELETELGVIVARVCPELLAEQGVGVITAAELINAWSHQGRIRSEAAFAKLCGTAPLPASSGKTIRHRLNRHDDRRANRALHAIITTRKRVHTNTRDYRQRRTTEGKTEREITRCLKRYLARQLFKTLENHATIT